MTRIISHLDCDGMCASALLIKALNEKSMKYSLTIVPQLDVDTIKRLAREESSLIIFADVGSEQVELINKYLSDSKVLVLDHHKPKITKTYANIVHINPHLFGINGSTEISGSGVVWYFAKKLCPDIEDYAHIPVIGAIGDNQARGGFRGLNKEILTTALKKKKLKVSKGLRLFGAQSKPLHKVLEHSVDTYIPGVTGSEKGALDFLQSLKIEPRVGNNWKKLINLTDDELSKLTQGILQRRSNETSPDDIFGDIYTLVDEEEGPLRDAREYSTLLNACGRLGKSSLGIGALLGNDQMKKKAIRILSEYRRELMTALAWYDNSKSIIKQDGYYIVNAKDNILPTMIGTVASIISRANKIKPGTVVVTLARTSDEKTKVSARLSPGTKNLDARKILSEIIDIAGGESGGHQNAAGALIDTANEQNFIKNAKRILEKYTMIEIV